MRFIVYAEPVDGRGPKVRQKVDALCSTDAINAVCGPLEAQHGELYTASRVKRVVRLADSAGEKP